MKENVLCFVISIIYLATQTLQACIHHQHAKDMYLHYYDDLTSKTSRRLLQETPIIGKQNIYDCSLRIMADYRWLTGNESENNLVKRVMNITANFYYNMLKVQRADLIKYPQSNKTCYNIAVPQEYIQRGVAADLGIFVQSGTNFTGIATARSIFCANLKSNNRSIWGTIIWNLNLMEFTSIKFQRMVFIGIHETMHVLGYSPNLFVSFPTGNPFFNDGQFMYVTSPAIIRQMKLHFNCSNLKGLNLQKGTIIDNSHAQFDVLGNDVMSASVRDGAYFSRITAAVLETSGWYQVNYGLTQPTIWGKNKGCTFLTNHDCKFDQFCDEEGSFSCDSQAFGFGKCREYDLSHCKLYRGYNNTLCIDERYEKITLTKPLNALQKGGPKARCFSSNFMQIGSQPLELNNRCYQYVCSSSKSMIFITIGSAIFACYQPGQIILPPPGSGLQGTLTCPNNLDAYCNTKRTCAFNCNKNGVCINGLCLCTGSLILTSTCQESGLDIKITGQIGGIRNQQFGTTMANINLLNIFRFNFMK